MIKKIYLLLITASLVVLSSCSQEEENVEVVVPGASNYLIPAAVPSCYSTWTAQGTEPPSLDVSASSFEISRVGFVRKEASKTMFISVIKLTVDVPYGDPVVCVFGGDYLAALDKVNWFDKSPREAVIPAGVQKYSTSCPLKCGGFKDDSAFVAPGILEIRGYEIGTDGTRIPFRAETSFTIESI